MGPVPTEQRIEVIDVLRGFALIGIITANMRAFFAPMPAYFNPTLLWKDSGDHIAQALIDTLVSGKFITLFAWLFGLGFAVQLSRANERGTGFAGVYSRRLAALLLFGAAHSFLIWWGDILLGYAVTGFALILFRKRAQRTVMIWAQAMYWLPMVFMLAIVIASALGAKIPAPPEPTAQSLQETIRVYSQGTWAEIFQKRAQEWAALNIGFLFFFPRILGLFLFGFWTWRSGILRDIGANLDRIRRWWRWGLALGLTGNVAFQVINEVWRPNPMAPDFIGAAGFLIGSAGVPALSLFYACSIVLLWQDERWRARLRAFGAVGRMALTNYLLQSVVCTLLFYSYGFGFYGKIGPLVGILPTVLVYAAQVRFSVAWLGSFPFGPMEWLWRTMTYGRLGALRRSETAAGGASS